MCNIADFKQKIFDVAPENFEEHALELFQYQAEHNLFYQGYIKAIRCEVNAVKSVNEIPFLPIQYFKQEDIRTSDWEVKALFESSGTTGMVSSRHLVEDLKYYHRLAKQTFETQIASLSDCVILALLPNYLEKGNSSLVSMVQYFMEKTGSQDSGFYLDEQERLLNKLSQWKDSGKRLILWGVTYALLDLVEQNKIDLSNVIILETGGMKGRREEYIRTEIYSILRQRSKVKNIISEYGMTELMSQAYAKEDAKYTSPPWMKVIIREISDPFYRGLIGKTGAVNIIDLANVHSCAFIETQDIGKVEEDGCFEIIGRMDYSDTRGCSLLTV